MSQILVSYFYMEQASYPGQILRMLKKNDNIIKETILDSGAYSFYTHNVKDINVVTHTHKTLALQKKYKFTHLIQLDKVKDPFKTKINYQYQKNFGFCPVIQRGQALDEFKGEKKKIFIGGISKNLRKNEDVIKIAHECGKVLKDFHLLGVSGKDIVTKIPPCSIDSSSNSFVWIFGKIHLFGHQTKPIEYYRTPKGLDILKAFCRDYGLGEVWEDFKRYNHIENRYPISFLKIHWFSALMKDYKILKDYGVKNFEVLTPTHHRIFACYLWALREINRQKSFNLIS